MAFSQSFSLGEDTLNQLDVCDKNARSIEKKKCNDIEFRSPQNLSNRCKTNGNRKTGNQTIEVKTPKIDSSQPLEVINESPTEKSDIFGQSIAERLKNVTSLKKANRKHFRRSKSDPVSNNTIEKNATNMIYHEHGMTENYGSMFDSSIEWDEPNMVPPKSKSKLVDKFADDGFDTLLNDIQTQPKEQINDSNSSKETGIQELSDSSEMEQLNVSEIERIMKTTEFDQQSKQEKKFDGSFDFFSQDNDNKEQSQQIVQSHTNDDAIIWENSAFFNDFLSSQPINEASHDSIEEVIDPECSFSIKNPASCVEDEMKSCFLELTNELSKLDDRTINITQTIAAPSTDISIKQEQPKLNDIKPKTQTNVQQNNSNENKCNITNLIQWGCSNAIIREYQKKGVKEMFEWQAECLSNPKIKNEHRNLVYSAPTSAGKTFVSEILMFQTVLQRKKKVLFILPFISVVREKMYYLQDMLRSSGIRVEGFFGGYTAPGGFESVDIAVCTIEKANAITNRLLEQQKIDTIGMVVVDEVHLVSDANRGYILELLLAKILYCTKELDTPIQIVTMSATLPNSELLTKWLNAEFYRTDFRPINLNEMIKVGPNIYDRSMNPVRTISIDEYLPLENDQDNIGQLCIETILVGASVIVFCPSKDWCESLALHVAGSIYKLGTGQSATGSIGETIRQQINMQLIGEVKVHLRNTPTGLDSVLEKTISYGVAFHHAGLTFDERDIIETAFSNGSLRVIIATSTLSSGVNLPARRVIIRTPLFGGKPMNSLTYKQMIGRAGRMGKDTQGESILICSNVQMKIGQDLIGAQLKPLTSCLSTDSYTHLKRAVLEVIASGIAKRDIEIESFVKCTLFYSEHNFEIKYFKMALARALKRSQLKKKLSGILDECDELDQIGQCMQFLEQYEFIRLHFDEETQQLNFLATRLGYACLASSMPPSDGFLLFSELQKARQSFVLENELHAIYIVTPFSVCYQLQDIDWLLYLDLWEKLSTSMQRVGELVGVKESFLVKAMRGSGKLDQRSLQIHKRFYTALALQELINECSMHDVAIKYKMNRGTLQSLQQTSSTFAGIVKSFCSALNWEMLALIVSQMKDRIFFGVHQDLIEIMKIPILNSQRARALYKAGYHNLVDISKANLLAIEKCLIDSISFDVHKRDGETNYDADQRNKARLFFVTGKSGLTVNEAAKLIIDEAREFLQNEMGIANFVWSMENESANDVVVLNDVQAVEQASGQQTQTISIEIQSSAVKRKFSESIDNDRNERSEKRCRLNYDEIKQSHSDVSSTSDGSDVDSINLDTSVSIYNDENDDFIEKFKENKKQKTSVARRLQIVNVVKSFEDFNKFAVSINNVIECGLSLAVCRKKENEENNYKCIISSEFYIHGIAFCLDDQYIVHYLNCQDDTDSAIPFDKKIKFIEAILLTKKFTFKIDDAKAQLKTLLKILPNIYKINCSIEDPRIAHWLLKPNADRDFHKMIITYAPECYDLSCEMQEFEANPAITSKIRASIKCCVTRHIIKSQMKILQEFGNGSIYKAFKEMDMPIQKVLLHMELNGMAVNLNCLETLTEQISDHIGRIETEIYRLNGKRFAVYSSKTVAQVLKICKKNGTQAKRCTRADLEKCSNPIAKLILEHRSLNAILSKSIQPLSTKVINNRIHPNSFSFTTTGRISMYEPNLQNVAKDFKTEFKVPMSPEYFSCRSAFAVPSNRMLVSADFCQLELRVLAHLSEDQSLIGIFSTVRDVFISVAAKWYKTTENEVSDKMRNNAKQICYGIIYGMGIKTLAATMKCDENEAETLYESFHNTYPGIRNYTQRIVHAARENGYVETIAGRRRYLPEINANEKPFKKSQAERQAVNTTIQGSAADIAKYAILRMERNLIKYQTVLKTDATCRIDLVLHLHDELLYEIPEDKSSQVMKILKSSMENCAKLLVPLRVKLKKGKNWGQMKTVE